MRIQFGKHMYAGYVIKVYASSGNKYINVDRYTRSKDIAGHDVSNLITYHNLTREEAMLILQQLTGNDERIYYEKS